MGAYEWNLPEGIDDFMTETNNLVLVVYPNPFYTSTIIGYKLAKPGNVNITVYNHLGQHIEIIDQGNYLSGKQQYIWNASGLPNGIYFVQVRAGQEMGMRKVVKMR